MVGEQEVLVWDFDVLGSSQGDHWPAIVGEKWKVVQYADF